MFNFWLLTMAPVLTDRHRTKDRFWGRTFRAYAPLDEVIQFARDGLHQNDADSAIILDMGDTEGTADKVVATVERKCLKDPKAISAPLT